MHLVAANTIQLGYVYTDLSVKCFNNNVFT